MASSCVDKLIDKTGRVFGRAGRHITGACGTKAPAAGWGDTSQSLCKANDACTTGSSNASHINALPPAQCDVAQLTAALQNLALVLEPRTFWSHTSPASSKIAPRSVAM